MYLSGPVAVPREARPSSMTAGDLIYHPLDAHGPWFEGVNDPCIEHSTTRSVAPDVSQRARLLCTVFESAAQPVHIRGSTCLVPNRSS